MDTALHSFFAGSSGEKGDKRADELGKKTLPRTVTVLSRRLDEPVFG